MIKFPFYKTMTMNKRLVLILICFYLLQSFLFKAQCQSFTKTELDEIYGQAKFIIEEYNNYMNLLGDINESPTDRRQSYKPSFLKLFVSANSTVFNDLDPEQKTSKEYTAEKYIDNLLLCSISSVWKTEIDLDQLSYGYVHPHTGNTFYIDIGVTKKVNGTYMKVSMNKKSWQVVFRIVFEIQPGNLKNNKNEEQRRIIKSFKIAGITRSGAGTPVVISEPVNPPADNRRSSYEPEMVYVQGGTFQMGSNDGEDDEKPVHPVTVGNFYMGKYEVTVAQFRNFVDETSYRTDAETGDGSYLWNGSKWEKRIGVNWKCDAEGNQRPQSEYNHPVIHVSWNDANAYCNWLSRKTGKTYRLPTEAEWEYAAGNGSRHTKYSWGNEDPNGKNEGNVADESAKRKFSNVTIWNGYDDGYVLTAPVGSFNPNDFGLYDMTGNVWEWCNDWYGKDYYKDSLSYNPKGLSDGSGRVYRGGSWGGNPQYCRVAHRSSDGPGDRSNYLGFRLVLVP